VLDRGWNRQFDDPIPLPNGSKLVTLRDAALYVTKLPKAEHDVPEWRAASPVSLDVPRTESPFQERATSFHEEQMGYLRNATTLRRRKHIGDVENWRGIGDSRDLACAFEPTRRVAGCSVSLHASFTYIDALN
jgi:hypothetical protein